MKKKTPKTNLATFTPLPSMEQVNADFKKQFKAPQDIDLFLMVIDRVKATNRTFTIDDVIYAAKPYEISVDKIKEYYSKWILEMESKNIISLIEGCYSNAIVVFN